MERRNFIKGLLIGAPAAGTALVKLANAEETAALKDTIKVNDPVILSAQDNVMSYEVGLAALIGNYPVYAHEYGNRGRLVPFGYITKLDYSTSIDCTSHWDGQIRLVPGLKTGKVDFEGR